MAYACMQYVACVRVGGCWHVLNDTASSEAGAWADVVRKCQQGRMQPTLLILEANIGALRCCQGHAVTCMLGYYKDNLCISIDICSYL